MDMNVHGPILLVFDFLLVHDDRTDRFALVHQVEPLVDLLELEGVSDHRIDLNSSIHVPVADLRHIGAAARPAESRALPDASRDELEWPGGDFLAGLGNADH